MSSTSAHQTEYHSTTANNSDSLWQVQKTKKKKYAPPRNTIEREEQTHKDSATREESNSGSDNINSSGSSGETGTRRYHPRSLFAASSLAQEEGSNDNNDDNDDDDDDHGKEEEKSSSPHSPLYRHPRHGGRSNTAAAATSVEQVNGVRVPQGHQPLEHAHTFWFFTKQRGQEPVDYESMMKRIGDFASVEGFWEFYSHLKRPSEVQAPSDYQMFRKDIKPMWEDPNNKDGGKWLIRVKKEYSDRLWEDLLLAIVGNQFESAGYDEVNGAVMSIRETHDVISVWNRTSDNRVVRERIRDTLRHVLKLPHKTVMDYRAHSQEGTKPPHPSQQQQQPQQSKVTEENPTESEQPSEAAAEKQEMHAQSS